MEENINRLVIKNAKILFVNIGDKKFRDSITIEATDNIIADINAWSSKNGITPKIKEYTDKEGRTGKQFKLNLSEFAELYDSEGKLIASTEIKSKGLSRGAIVNLVTYTFDYDNAFGRGKSYSVTQIVVKTAGKNRSTEDLNELLN